MEAFERTFLPSSSSGFSLDLKTTISVDVSVCSSPSPMYMRVCLVHFIIPDYQAFLLVSARLRELNNALVFFVFLHPYLSPNLDRLTRTIPESSECGQGGWEIFGDWHR